MSHFFAYLWKMKYIRRWGLMRNTETENIQEHSLEVALVAHALAVIRRDIFHHPSNPEHIAMIALYHEIGEVVVGDLPTPVKYFNDEIYTAFNRIEKLAKAKLLGMLPAELRGPYAELVSEDSVAPDEMELVKAADRICAYLKCRKELQNGNHDFSKAEKAVKKRLGEMKLPEVDYFLEQFVPSFDLTIDELNKEN